MEMSTSPRSTRSRRTTDSQRDSDSSQESESPKKKTEPTLAISKEKLKSPKTVMTPTNAWQGNTKVAGTPHSSPSSKSLARVKETITDQVETAGEVGPSKESSSVTAEIKEKDGITKSSSTLSPSQKTNSMKRSAPVPPTPSSTVRRSSRAPVPSSRFKDMEVGIIPSRKRSSANVITEVTEGFKDSETEITPSRKRSSANIISEDRNVESEQVKKKSKKISEKSQHSSAESNKLDDKGSIYESKEESPVIHPSTEALESESVPLSIEEMIHTNLQEEHFEKQTDDAKELSLEVHQVQLQTTGSEVHSTEIENVSSECVEETEMTEDNLIVEESPFPTISIGGQQLTFTKKDGETIAIVTIPPRLAKEASQSKSTQDLVSEVANVLSDSAVSPNEEKKSVSTPSHGHVVNKQKDVLSAPFTAVVGHDGSTYLNLSVEATSISSILKGKHLSAPKVNNPLQGHGRVLKYPYGSMIVKTSLVSPPSHSKEVSQSQDSAEPKPTYSLLYSKQTPQQADLPQLTGTPGITTVTLSSSVKSSEISQTPQRVVLVRQQPSQAAATSSTLIGIQQFKPAVSVLAPTVIRYPQDLPSKKTTSMLAVKSNTVVPAGNLPTIPKSASEILLQKLKDNQKQVIIKESVQAADSVVKESNHSGMEENESTSQEVVIEVQTDASQTARTSSEQNLTVTQTLQSTQILENEVTEKQQEAIVIAGNILDDEANGGEVQILTEITSHQEIQAHESSNENSNIKILKSGPTEDTAETHETGGATFSEKNTISIGSSEAPKTYTILTELKNVDPSTINANMSVIQDLQTTVESYKVDEDTHRIITNDKVEGNDSSGSKDKEKILDKIKGLEGNQDFDVRVVSEEEVTEEIIESSSNQTHIESKDRDSTEAEVIIKEEIDDEGEDIKPDIEKQTSGTQTVYSPRLTELNNRTHHKLANVVDTGVEKKHIYYVSVLPSKSVVTKSKTNMSLYSGATNWIVDDNGMYCCEKCDYQTDRKANFYKHRRSHSGAKPHVCQVCGYKAGTSSNLKRHMGIHKDIREHKCDICGLCFRQKIHLERHIKYKHEEKSIKCPMCDYICANEQPDLKMHIKRRHSNENMGEVLSCPECKVEVGNKRDLKQHMKFHKDGPELKLFCKECSFVTDCQSRLKRHTAIHSKQKPFQCGVCSYRAAQKEHVLRHLRTQHKIDVKKDKKRPWKRHKKTDSEDGSRERADFTSGDKIFACNHCTMRFAKLINLYKHLHTQHSDIMPTETEGNYYCVVCEYSTSSKKNLLVHMRRHNMADQTPPTHVYSCVLCRYVNPRRRNLFQHMRKKHNIVISRSSENGDEDGESQDMEISEVINSVNRTLAPSSGRKAASTETGDVKEGNEDLAGVANMIKIEDLTHSSTSGETVDVQTLVIDNSGTGVSDVVHTTAHADALEGLQALAEQAGLIDNIIEEQVPTAEEQPTIVIDGESGNRTDLIRSIETVGGQYHQIIQSEETVASGSTEITQGVELTEDQLSSLRTGDIVEMEGDLYIVEMTQDPNNPNKQMLSFLPVTTTQISQDT